MFSHRIRIN